MLLPGKSTTGCPMDGRCMEVCGGQDCVGVYVLSFGELLVGPVHSEPLGHLYIVLALPRGGI